MEPKTGKRIVSKGAYVKAQSRRAWLWGQVVSISFAGVATLGILIKGLHHGMSFIQGVSGLILVVGTLLSIWFVRDTSKEIRGLETVVPFTRANTADLPTPETLVRASEELMHAQKSMLLRAALEGQETPPEQLVRASVFFSASRSGHPGQE